MVQLSAITYPPLVVSIHPSNIPFNIQAVLFYLTDGSFPHHLADLALWPVKMFPKILLDNEESQHREGTRAYVTFIKWIGGYAENLGGSGFDYRIAKPLF